MIHTSVARRIVGRVSETRVGGGFGQLRTATTGRVSYTAGDSGKIDATCPSGAHAEHDQVESRRAGRRSRRRPRRRRRRRRRTRRPTAAIAMHPGRDRAGRGRAARPGPASRCGPDRPPARNARRPRRSRPATSRSASRAGEAFRWASTLVPTPPPVSATPGIRPVDWMSTSVVTSRAAVVAASSASVRVDDDLALAHDASPRGGRFGPGCVARRGRAACRRPVRTARRRDGRPLGVDRRSARSADRRRAERPRRSGASARAARGRGLPAAPAACLATSARPLVSTSAYTSSASSRRSSSARQSRRPRRGSATCRSGWLATFSSAVMVCGRTRLMSPDRRVSTTECSPGRPWPAT